MKVKVHVDRGAAIMCGNEQHGWQIVDVRLTDLTEAERAILAAAPTDADGCTWLKPSVSTSDLAGVRQAITMVNQERKREAEESLVRQEAARCHAAVALTDPTANWYDGYDQYPHPLEYEFSYCDDYRRAYDEYPGVAARRLLARVVWHRERDQMENEIRARAEADKLARAQAREDGEKRLRTWAAEHGSTRLHLLMEEEHQSWVGIAEDEYIAAHTPAGYRQFPPNAEERVRTKPEEADILALREARQLALNSSEGVLTRPRMAWIVERARMGERKGYTSEAVVDKYAATLLTVVCPTGREARVLQPVTGLKTT